MSFVYVTGVGNPTSTVLTNARREELVEITAELSRQVGHPVPLVLDRAYDLLVHDPEVERPVSMIGRDRAGLVYEIGTLSKILAPALRIGYLIGPPGPLCDALAQRTSDIGFSAPLINQEIAAYLLEHDIGEQMDKVHAGYRRKAARIGAAIRNLLGTVLEECRGGSAGFYFYLSLNGVPTGQGTPFHRFLSRTTGDPRLDGTDGRRGPRVLYIPGEYCVRTGGKLAQAGRRQLRISYGFEKTPRIIEALQYMRQAVAYARP